MNFDQDFASRSLLGLPLSSMEELFITENFAVLDGEFACRSLLGLPGNSVEELIYHNRKFY